MKNSSLIELLKGLTEAEWQLLGGRVPFHGPDAALLFRYLSQNSPFANPEQLDKKMVYKTVFDSRSYNDQRMRDAMTDLAAAAKQVITESELATQEHTRQLLQLKALRKRNMYQNYQRTFNRLQKHTTQHVPFTEEELLHQYHLTQEREAYFALRQNRQPDQALQDRMDVLDRFYILAKLKLTCEQLNRMHILQADYQPVMLREVVGLLDTSPQYLSHAGILLYYRVLQMLMQPHRQNLYTQLVNDLVQHEAKFDREEARNLYRYAQNYCIRMINQGNADYFRLLLELYQKQLQSRLLLPDGVLDHTDYKNIVTVGLRLKDYEWTANFIAQYKEALPEELREAAWLYNQANYLYESGQYTQAGDMLVNQNFADFYYNLSARHLLLKIFYDGQEWEALAYQLESFRLYLLRNKTISPANRMSNLNFLKVMKNLAMLRQKCEYLPNAQVFAKLAKIEQAIGHYQPLANKNWLLEQAGKMKEMF